MEQDFTLKNIKDFIKQKFNMNWYGFIYDEEANGSYRKAELKDFKELRYHRFQVDDPRDSIRTLSYTDKYPCDYISIMLTNNIFRVAPMKDYSNQWIEFRQNTKQTEETLSITN